MPSILRALHSSPSRISPVDPAIMIPPTELIEEETIPHYNSKCFYPTKLYEILNGRYQIVAKLGWGATSTVWLARDLKQWRWRPARYVAVKITKHNYATPYTPHGASNELKIAREIANTHSKSPGRLFVSTLLDSFSISNPMEGNHACMVFEPLCEPLWMLQQRFSGNVIPLRLLKLIALMVLEGLRYLHDECHIVHTDLKSDNIMMALRNPYALSLVANEELHSPLPQKRLWDRTIYLSRYDYARQSKNLGRPVITDFGLAVKGDGPLLYHPIQPNEYRAPEVVLGAEWRYSADIWNLGALLWDLATGSGPFDLHDEKGPLAFSSEKYMAKIISVLGYPSSNVLYRGRETSRYFDKKGTFRYLPMLRAYNGPDNGLASQLPPLENETPEDKEMFVAFISRMLKWRPEDRSNAENLLEDPFLNIQVGVPNGMEGVKGKEKKRWSWNMEKM